MDTPKEFFRMYYYILQAHTPLRPGPGFKKLLNRAGIQEVEPPSNAVLIKYFQTLLAETNKPKDTIPLQTMTPLIEVQTGGAWYNSIYQTVNRHRNTLEFAVISMTLAVGTRMSLTANDDQHFLNSGLMNLLLVVSAGAAGALVGSTQNADREERERRQRLIEEMAGVNPRRRAELLEQEERRIRRRLRAEGRNREDILEDEIIELQRAVDQQIRNRVREFQGEQARGLDEPNRFSILTIPSSGELRIKGTNNAGNALTDPISYVDFQNGDKVAVIKNNKRAFMLVDSLQAWIANPSRPGPPKNPLTNEIFQKEDVSVYTLKLTTSGGKRKEKRRKTKKNKV